MDTTPWWQRPWDSPQDPPTDVLGHPVPIEQFVAGAEQVVIALQYLTAYPDGCILTLQVAVRRNSLDDAAWKSVLGNHYADMDSAADNGGPTFGTRFPDGSRATTTIGGFTAHDGPDFSKRPEGPIIEDAGSDSSSDDQYFYCHLRLWLWPLPPASNFEFDVQWERLGLNLTATTLDGSAVVDAAQKARPFWA